MCKVHLLRLQVIHELNCKFIILESFQYVTCTFAIFVF